MIEAKVQQPIDLLLQLEALPDGSPFDLEAGAYFWQEGGGKYPINAFYNGQREYVIRFTPPSAGTWQFSHYGDLPEAIQGTYSLEASLDTTLPIKGAVGIDPERPQKFIYQDGSPYFALAFELDWLFALDYGNAQGIPRTEKIIGTIAEHGFNQVVMNVYAYDVNWVKDERVPKEYEYRKPAFSPFGGNNEQPDFSTLNLDFFQHLDRVIQHLHEQEVVAYLMIYVWNKNVNWPEMYTAADNRYFDYVISSVVVDVLCFVIDNLPDKFRRCR